MRIIEFCGNPGCGKSTVCDALEKELKVQGYRVVNLQKRKKSDTIWKKVDKVIRTIRYRYYGPNQKLRRVLYPVSRNHKWADRILEAKWLISRHMDYDYLLFDEGGIQFTSSLLDETVEGMEKLQTTMDTEYYIAPTLLFQCSVDMDENIKRLLGRNKEGDRFVLKDENEMKKKLDAKEQLLNSIYAYDWKEIRVRKIDMENTEKAVDACMRFLKEWES